MSETPTQIDSTINDDKESLINDSNGVEENGSIDRTSTSLALPLSSDLSYYFTDPPSKTGWRNHLFATLTLLALATISTVTLPSYLQAVNVKSDVYFGLMITSLCSSILGVLLVAVSKVRQRDWSLLRCPLPLGKALRLGVHLGLSGLWVFYARDRNRVLCHLQDPAAAALLPFTLVGHFFFSSKVDNTRKLFCLVAAIIGLFICIDFQIWDEFMCHGHANPEMAVSQRKWTSDESAVWTVVYLIGLASFALFLIILDREMKGDRPECLVATIALTPTTPTLPPYSESMTEDLNETLLRCQEADDRTRQAKMIPYLSEDRSQEIFHKGQILVLYLWIQIFAVITVLVCSWTNLISFLGKAGSSAAFLKSIQDGFLCHFYPSEECGNVLLLEWVFIISTTFLLLSVLFFVNYSGTCSAPYLAALLTTALPLSTFCWSFFRTDNGFVWSPSFTGETGFTVVGLPIIIVALSFYRYYAIKENRCLKS